MNQAQIENNIQELIKSFNKDTFIYDLLLAYNTPKSIIARLQKGDLNLSKVADEILLKKKLFFKAALAESPQALLDRVKKSDDATKHSPRFIVVTDYTTLLAIDTKTTETLDTPLIELAKHFDFFLPWAGMEKAQHQTENPADVKAAERMARLYDQIKKDNPTDTQEQVHNLNVFLSRLLFCFFAEDTDIFAKAQFTHSISSHTQHDGSDLQPYLDKLYEIMNTDYPKRENIPAYLAAFPYVNGGLFHDKNKHTAPVFTRRSRQLLIENGELDWSAINPDIFGSMIQAVITPEHRGGLGMHYTSVPNIMKVIEPLFLTDLQEELAASKYEPRRLNKLLDRIGKIKIFDPACGSGNFLIIAYKELRLLEIKILQQLQHLQKIASGFEPYQLELIPKAQLTMAVSYQHTLFTRVELFNFYGIELDDFAHEVAILSLWLAQHQMNMQFKDAFGTGNPTLPLKEGGNIVHGNATRIDWETVCPKKEGDEIYILGNPPYLGARIQDSVQKSDMNFVFKSFTNYKDLDYIACWFYKGAIYISSTDAQMAFVSTNSICQGLQVGLLWPSIFKLGIEIQFAYLSFKWRNSAKGNAGVTVAIIGLAKKTKRQKVIFEHNRGKSVHNINAYLIDADYIIVNPRSNPLSFKFKIFKGNQATDGGWLILEELEKDEIINEDSQYNSLIKNLVGSQELIKGIRRYCLWIKENDYELAKTNLKIFERLENVRNVRLMSPDEGTRELSNTPYKFRDCHETLTSSIVIPGVSSENRDYVPIGFYTSDTIITNSAFVIYDSPPWLFAVVTSKLHMVWLN